MNVDIFIVLLSVSWILLCAVLIVLLIVLSKLNQPKKSSDTKLLQDQIFHLSKTLDYKLTESNKNLTDNMSKTFATSSKISEDSNKRIEEITKRLTELGETNKQIQDIGMQLKWLEHVLKNPKQRWNLGEYFLKELIENVFSADQYKLQYTLSTWIVDAALFLGGKTIPIDAKFPQENYQKLIESEDEFSTKKYSSELKKDIKNRIDEVSKYIIPEEDTTDFAFMLIPAEWMYYDIFINKLWDVTPSKLIEYWFSKKSYYLFSKLILCLSSNSSSRYEISQNRRKSKRNTKICYKTPKRSRNIWRSILKTLKFPQYNGQPL